jgi:hypothetical protein
MWTDPYSYEGVWKEGVSRSPRPLQNSAFTGKNENYPGIWRGRGWVRPAKEVKKGKRYRYKCCESGSGEKNLMDGHDTVYSDWEGQILLGWVRQNGLRR